MPIDYPTEISHLKAKTGSVYALIVALASEVAEIRQHFDDLESRATPATCRHLNPIGDYCAYCNETPEG